MPTTAILRSVTVRGIEVDLRFKRSSARRFAVIAVRPEPIHVEGVGTYVAFAEIDRTTGFDDIARKCVARYNDGRDNGPGVTYVAVDLFTGEEI